MTFIRKFILFIIIPVILTSGGEFVLKHAVNTQSETTSISTMSKSNIDFLASATVLLENPAIILAFCMIITGGILWLVAMSHFELSFLYPFQSLNLLVVVVGSQVFLGEAVSLYRYIAVLLIMGGLIVISRSPNKIN